MGFGRGIERGAVGDVRVVSLAAFSLKSTRDGPKFQLEDIPANVHEFRGSQSYGSSHDAIDVRHAAAFDLGR